jgi:TolB protein
MALIASLAGSSLLTYFAIVRSDFERAQPVIPSVRAERVEVQLAPTSAPATVAAAIPTAVATLTAEQSAPTAEVNRIALVNDQGQIETMSPHGEDRRVLTLESDDAIFQFPAWAPDSQRVAVIGSRFSGGGIYVLEDAARTGSLVERQIYFSDEETPFYLFWSPDSSHVAFLANYSSNSMGLNVVAGDGTDRSRLLATGAPFYWDWSADGRQLLIHSGSDRFDQTLALIDLEGATQADNLATPGDFQAPDIGPDGRYWAFAEQVEDGLSSLVIIDTQTGERQSYEEGGSIALNWSPTRDQIAFTNSGTGDHPYWGSLRVLDAVTGEVRLLSTRTVLAFFWSPDGRSIAFITLGRDERNDGDIVGAPQKSRTFGRVANVPVQQSSRGFLTLSVVDVETGQGLRLLDFEPTATYISQFLPFFDQYALSHRVWSPDSSALVLPVREDETDMILVVPARGGRPYHLAEGDIAFWSHR